MRRQENEIREAVKGRTGESNVLTVINVLYTIKVMVEEEEEEEKEEENVRE